MLLNTSPAGEIPLLGWLLWREDGEGNRLQLTLVNPSGRLRKTVARLENAKLLGCKTTRTRLSLPPRSIRRAEFPLGDRKLYEDLYLARVRVGGMTLTAPVPPVLVNGDFEIDRNRDRVPEFWGTWNPMVEHQFNRHVQDVDLLEELDGKLSSLKPLSGRYCLKNPPAFDYVGKQLGHPYKYVKMHYSPATQQYIFLRPGASYRLRFAVRVEKGTNGSVGVSVGNLRVKLNCSEIGTGKWKTFEHKLDIPADGRIMQMLTLLSDADHPVYFDSVSIEETTDLESKTDDTSRR